MNVVCCRHFDLEEAKRSSPPLAKPNTLSEIKKGRHAGYTLLADRATDPKLSLRIVDLSDISLLPMAFLENVAVRQNPRLRLRAPYREYLSQAFARFYMRVALPKDVVIG